MRTEFLPNEVAFWLDRRETPPRTDGLHVSKVILAMLQAVSRNYDHWGKDGDVDQKPAWEMGYAWEDVVATTLAKRVKVQESETLLPATEIARDAIYGTPDRVIYDHVASRLVVEELKCTWMSCRGLEADPSAITDNPKFAYWLLQSKTYAAMLNRPFGELTRTIDAWPKAMNTWPGDKTPIVRVRALFINGAYRGEFPIPMAWEFGYTADELNEHWENVREYAHTVLDPTVNATDSEALND